MTRFLFRNLIHLTFCILMLVALAGCPLTQFYRQGNIEKGLAELERLAMQCGANEEQIIQASSGYAGGGDPGALAGAEGACGDPNAACSSEAAVRAAAAAGTLGFALNVLRGKEEEASQKADDLEIAETALQASKTAAIKAAEAAIASEDLRVFGQGTTQQTAAEINAINAGADPDIAKAAAAAAITPNTHLAAMRAAQDRGYSEDEARAVAKAISVGPDLVEAVEAVREADRALKDAWVAAYTAAKPAGPGITDEQASAVADAVVERIRRMMTPGDTINRLPPSQRVDDIRGAGTTAAFEAGVSPDWVRAEAGFLAGNAAKGVLSRAGFDLVSGASWPTEAWQTVEDTRRVVANVAVRSGVDEDDAYKLAHSALNAKVDAYRQAETNATAAALSAMRQKVQATIDTNRRAAQAAADAYLAALRNGESVDQARTAAKQAALDAGAESNIAENISEAFADKLGDDPNPVLGRVDQVAREATPTYDWDDEDWANWEDRASAEAAAYGRAAAMAVAVQDADIERENLSGPGVAVTEEFQEKVQRIAGRVAEKLEDGQQAAEDAGDAWTFKKAGADPKDPAYYYGPEIVYPTDWYGDNINNGIATYGHLDVAYHTLSNSPGYIAERLAKNPNIQVPLIGPSGADWHIQATKIVNRTNDIKEAAYKLLQASEQVRDQLEREAIEAVQEINDLAARSEEYANEKIEQVRQECGLAGSPQGGPQADGLPGVPITPTSGIVDKEGDAAVELWQARNQRGVNFFDFNNPTGEPATSTASSSSSSLSSSAPDYSGTYTGNLTVASDPGFHESDYRLADAMNNPYTLTVTISSITISGSAPFLTVTGALNANGMSFTNLSGMGTIPPAFPATVAATAGTFTGTGGSGSTLQFTYTVNVTGNQPVAYSFSGVQ